MDRLADDPYRRRVLRQVEAHTLQETGNRSERLILLDASGRPLFVKEGAADGVTLSDEEVQRWRGRGYLVTHNHPAGLSFTAGDLLAATALNVQELNAFTSATRYRLVVHAGSAWPSPWEALAAIEDIDTRIRAIVEGRLAAGVISPAAALALHRHTRWRLFAQRFPAAVHYGVEDR